MKKKLMSLVLALVMCLSLSVPAFAADHGTESGSEAHSAVLISEYDVIVGLREMPSNKLEEAGLSQEEIAYIESNNIENELLIRKELPSDILSSDYRYSEAQIVLLRTYNGERLENAPQFAALAGSLEFGTPSVNVATNTRVGLRVSWEWTTVPITSIGDAIGVRFTGTFGSNSGNFRMDYSTSYNKVNYWQSGQIKAKNYSFKVPEDADATYAGICEFPFTYTVGSFQGGALDGTAYMYFNTTEGSAVWSSIDISCIFAHTAGILGLSLGFPLSGGFSVGTGTSRADSFSGYINKSSGSWHNN